MDAALSVAPEIWTSELPGQRDTGWLPTASLPEVQTVLWDKIPKHTRY